MSFIPLPEGNNTPETVRRLRAIDAEFFGSISAARGTLGDLTINGTLLLGTDGQLVTASSAPRWVMGSDLYPQGDPFVYQSGDADELYAGRLNASYMPLTDRIATIGLNGPSIGTGALFTDEGRGNLNLSSDYTNKIGRADLFAAAGGAAWAAKLDIAALGINGATGIITINASDYTQVTGGEFQLQFGTAALPGLSFVNDANTGMYRVGADIIGFSAGNARRLSVSAGAVVVGSTANRTPLMKADADGAVATPSYSFFGDQNTGMYSSVADHLQFTAGGTQYLQIDHAATSVTVDNAGFGVGIGFGNSLTAGYFYNAPPTTAAAANATWVLASGAIYYLSRSTSSARYKSDIKTADWLADIALRPVQFWSNTDEIYQYGLIAEEVVDAIGAEAAELNGEGQVENYDVRAVLAVLVAKVNKLEREIAQLRGDR